MTSTIIRAATEEDLPFVRTLQQQWYEENNTHGYVPETLEEITKYPKDYFIVAEVEERVIGFGYAIVATSEGNTIIASGVEYLRIEDIYVAKSMRSQGIGGKILEQLIHLASSNGMKDFMVYSAKKELLRIINFYHKHKFKSWYVMLYRQE